MRKVTCMCETIFDADLPEEIRSRCRPGRPRRDPGGRFPRRLVPELRRAAQARAPGEARLEEARPGPRRAARAREDVPLQGRGRNCPKAPRPWWAIPSSSSGRRMLEDELDPETRSRSSSIGSSQKAEEAGPRGGYQCRLRRREGRQARLPPVRAQGGRDSGPPRRSGNLRQDARRQGAQRCARPPSTKVFKGPYRSIRILETERPVYSLRNRPAYTD